MRIILACLSEAGNKSVISHEIGLSKSSSVLTWTWPQRLGRLVLLLEGTSQERSGDGIRPWGESERTAGRSESDRSVARNGGSGMLDVAGRHGRRRHQSREIAGRRGRAPHGTADNLR